MHFFYDNRRLLAGVLLSAALLTGCAPKEVPRALTSRRQSLYFGK